MNKRAHQISVANWGGQTGDVCYDRRHFLRLLRVTGVTVLAGPLLAACSIATSQRRFAVYISGPQVVEFSPASLTVPRGSTVVWKNQDLAPHTVTCDPGLLPDGAPHNLVLLPEDAEPWNSGDLYTGQSWSHTFTQSGQYIYFSQRGSVATLLGNVIVTG
jgi:plastocyanin